MQVHHITDSEFLSSPIPESSMLRTPSAIEGQGGAITEAQSRERGRMLQVRDQMAQLAAENGLKVSPGIEASMAKLPTPAVAHVRNHDEPIDNYLQRRQDYLDGKTKGMPGASLGVAVRMEMLPTPIVRDYKDGSAPQTRDGKVSTDTVARAIFNSGEVTEISWGKFEPAVKRWEQVIDRAAPAPTKPDGKDGAHRLSSRFTEWMMGLPDGWITDAGLSRVDELKACGNGVVPQQAELALRILLQGTDFDQTVE